MIRKIKFNNFYSFKDEQEINFLANKKKSYAYFNSNKGDQITKIATFLGSNASGKTNIIRLFSFLSYFICNIKERTPVNSLNTGYKTFFGSTKPSNFYIEFEDKDIIYFYDFSIQENIIIKESLSIKEIKKNSKKTKIFSRKLNKAEILMNDSRQSFKNIRLDTSFVAFLNSLYDMKIIKNIYNYFFSLETNINEKGEINNTYHQIKSLLIYLKDKELKEEMEDFISRFDIGLSGFEIKRKVIKNANKTEISVKGIHGTIEKAKKLDFNYESRGTQSLFFILAKILNGLKNNSVIVIDELELGLHPEALNKIISYFIDKNEHGNAQLIFSSQDLNFMNNLDMHQIYLIEKNKYGESFSYRLNQVEGVRPDENFLSKYMTGSYGAFPKIRI